MDAVALGLGARQHRQVRPGGPRSGRGAENAAKLYPRANFELWTALTAAAYAHICAGDYKKAEGFAREALESLGTNASPKDARWHETRGYIALSLAGQKRYAEALPLLEPTVQFYGSGRKYFPYGDRLRAGLQEARKALLR